MGQSRFLLLTFPIILASVPSWGLYVPAGFTCTRDKPTSGVPVYSTPPAPSATTLYVDLIHIFCREIDRYGRAHGFHARPLNRDPASVSTRHANVLDVANNDSDTSMYRRVRIYDTYTGPTNYVIKGVSSIWPTRWTMEQIVKAITLLGDKCR